ncbi:MAG: amidohydrolase family protein, partial [Planctomycetota bacterium]
MSTLYVAGSVVPRRGIRLSPGAVRVEGDRITWVGAPDAAPAAEHRLELGGATLLPGLVNAHSHLDLTHLRGQVPYRGEFAAWLASIRSRRTDAGVREAAAAGIHEAVGRGTTSFGDFVSPQTFPAVVDAFAQTGARGRLFVEAVGFRPDGADAAFERVWELVEMQALPAGLVTGLGPHAPYSVSRELLQRMVAVADGHGRPLAVHVGETLEELAFLRHGIGPLRELLRRLGADDPGHRPYGSVPAFLEQLELQDAPLLLVHANYVRPRDVPAAAFVVYCPTAHAFFGHPEHPALEFIEAGVRVALGSDSAASGPSVDVWSEIRHLARARPDLDPAALFR